MDLLNETMFLDGMSKVIVLIPRVCVVVMAAYVSMRVKVLREALSNTHLYWQHQLFAALFFGLLAIIGTHSGIKVDIHQTEMIANWTPAMAFSLEDGQVIIGFRDLMVFTAGLFGGPWIGLGAGLLAGIERYAINGGDVRITGIGTVILGLVAGLSRQFWPQWTTSIKGILTVTLGGTFSLALFLSIVIPSYADAITTIKEMIIPESLVNSLGCLLFLVVMKDLESDQLKIAAQRAELRALQAQVEPHFLNNTLNAIQTLISSNPQAASQYVAKLARFMDKTRQNAGANAIPLAEELLQLSYYMDFQNLRFPGKFYLHEEIAKNLMDYYIPPRSLQTLAENALIHGRHGKTEILAITIKGKDCENNILLSVIDNGNGMTSERAGLLGKQEVKSERGSGSALYLMSQSLYLAFNGSAKLVINSELNSGTEVILNLPKRCKPW